MSRIRLLPSHLVDQIAAGEVIERPASALKELIENSLDAQATEISINLSQGGLKSISVSDNGYGMIEDELCLAVKRHATSKLPNANLFQIKSIGFRGEALPSIAAVSDFDISSRTEKMEHGWKIHIKHGTIYPTNPVAHAVGTTVTFRDIFNKIPARRKFLKTQRSEAGKCFEVIKQLAMTKPGVAFKVYENDKTILNFPAIMIRYSHERPEGMDEGTLIMSGLKKDSVIEAIGITKSFSVENRVFKIVQDYDVDNYSKKIIKIVHSYIDYVNRNVWFKNI